MSQEFTEWDYPGDFLQQFPRNHMGVIGTTFCQKVRGGARTVPELLAAVTEHARYRLDGLSEWDADETERTWRRMFEAVGTPEAEHFARFILWRESLPYAERERLKAASRAKNGAEYMRQAMAAKPPTDKQLALLKEKGCWVVPRTRLEASDLIDGYFNPRRSGDHVPPGAEEDIPF